MHGSSPRVRGTPPNQGCITKSFRFIPACAGNTHTVAASVNNVAVHPRVCGEHFEASSPPCFSSGSSPRVRGTPGPLVIQRIVFRFIPACAGNTGKAENGTYKRSVHPRVCGEHCLFLRFRLFGFGSSPRVRGTPPADRSAAKRVRFIPACAGNTLPSVRPWIDAPGSSPRVRGTPAGGPGSPRCGRFIPACAGNTIGCGTVRPPEPVHPRVCGEHISARVGVDG